MQQQEDAYYRIKRKYMLQTEAEEFEQTKKEHAQQTRLKKTFVNEPQQTPVREVNVKKF